MSTTTLPPPDPNTRLTAIETELRSKARLNAGAWALFLAVVVAGLGGLVTYGEIKTRLEYLERQSREQADTARAVGDLRTELRVMAAEQRQSNVAQQAASAAVLERLQQLESRRPR